MTQAEQKKSGKWPWLIVLIGLMFLGLTAWAILMAAQGTSPVTDPAYYSHGLRYNQTRVEALAAEAMDWRISSSIDDHRLTIVLRTGDLEPVSGCNGEIILYNSEKRLALPLKENGNGAYTAEIPTDLTGNLTGDLLLKRDGARINRRLLINF